MLAKVSKYRNKIADLPAIFMFLIWFALSVYFAQSRWLFADSAYTFFRILDGQSLIYDRYSNLIQLWPARLLAYAGLPANTVLHTLNLTLPVLFVLAWLYCRRYSRGNALIFPISLWLTGPQMFFLGYSEISMAVLFFGLLFCDLKLNSNWDKLKTFTIVTLMLMSHPAGILFLIPLLFRHIRQIGRNSVFSLGLIIALAFGVKMVISPDTNPYDKGMLGNLVNPDNWMNLPQSYSLRYFISAFTGWMWPLGVAVLFLLVLFVRSFRKNGGVKLTVLIYLLFIMLVVLVTLLVYHAGDANVMMEKFFYPILLIALAGVLIFDAHKVLSALFALSVLTFSFIGIARETYFYNQRLINLNQMIEKRVSDNQFKVITNLKSEALANTWALPYETMCLSAIVQSPTVTIRFSENGKLKSDSAVVSDSLYLGAPFMPPWPQRTLNRVYFRLPETVYRIDSLSY